MIDRFAKTPGPTGELSETELADASGGFFIGFIQQAWSRATEWCLIDPKNESISCPPWAK